MTKKHFTAILLALACVAALFGIGALSMNTKKSEHASQMEKILGSPPYVGYFPNNIPNEHFGSEPGPEEIGFNDSWPKPNCHIKKLTSENFVLQESQHSKFDPSRIGYAYMDTTKGRAFFYSGVMFINGKSYIAKNDKNENPSLDSYFVLNCIKSMGVNYWDFYAN